MLRITVHRNRKPLTLQLEGKLAGPWVQELRDCWQSALAETEAPAVCIDLSAVSFVDWAGKALLAAMHAQGAELVAADCLMKAVVAEITTDRPKVRH